MRSLYKFILFLIITIAGNNVFAQRALIEMPNTINHPAINVSHPVISGDGSTLLYLSDYSDQGGLTMYWSQKNGALWTKGVEMVRTVNRPELNLQGAYSLNNDGSKIIVTSRKEGVGGFDIFYSNRSGTNWSTTMNFGAPINSPSHEGAGVLTSDGKGIYFMRCAQMNEQMAEGCKLYYAENKYGRWDEPQLLPTNINNFNPQMPKISSDGNTLIFSSKNAGGKGGYDLYLTTKTGATWSDPINLEFINTPLDDKVVSFGPRGRYLFTTKKGEKTTELVQVLIPEELRPKSVYRVEGTVLGEGAVQVPATLTIMDMTNKQLLLKQKVDNGFFIFTLNEGNVYDVSISPEDHNLLYFAKIYDLEEVPSRDRESVEITLQPADLDSPIKLGNIYFEEYSAELDYKSQFEVRRIADYLRSNPQYGITISSVLNSYTEDSLQSSPDLTEVRWDTTYSTREFMLLSDLMDTEANDTLFIDSLKTSGQYITITNDTLLYILESDSIHLQNNEEIVTASVKEMKISQTFHNDRTMKEAEALKFALINQGVEAEKIFLDSKVSSTSESYDRYIEISFIAL